nr:hypothetical protein HMPREF0276_1790 [Corynebacterium accolens ATCC 49725]
MYAWRLIPAHAGSTTLEELREKLIEAHPRSRGEHGITGRLIELTDGSSPLTRGARVSAFTSCGQSGLIPAHAGSTSHQREAGALDSAHPRSRGEHSPLRR